MGTLFNTSDRVTRLQGRWHTSVDVFGPLFTTWSSTTVSQANNGFGHALKSLATGSSAEALSSYNAAVAESFQQETTATQIYCDSSPYCYAWCKSPSSTGQT